MLFQRHEAVAVLAKPAAARPSNPVDRVLGPSLCPLFQTFAGPELVASIAARLDEGRERGLGDRSPRNVEGLQFNGMFPLLVVENGGDRRSRADEECPSRDLDILIEWLSARSYWLRPVRSRVAKRLARGPLAR